MTRADGTRHATNTSVVKTVTTATTISTLRTSFGTLMGVGHVLLCIVVEAAMASSSFFSCSTVSPSFHFLPLGNRAPPRGWGGTLLSRRNLSTHPVSPSPIQLGMDETLRILHAHRALEEPVHDDHQGYHRDTTNDARRNLAA
jgi:hypothetical protein